MGGLPRREAALAELVITNTRGKITLRLRIPSAPVQYTLV